MRVEKPRAIPLADQAVVEIVRTREFFTEERAATKKMLTARSPVAAASGEELCYLALGSNVGCPVANFSTALDELRKRGVTVLATSGLFVTPATYNTSQPDFLNAVVAVSTTLDPFSLLRAIKETEEGLGRDLKGERNGPRPIDVDILLHGSTTLESATLTIPHVDLHRRLFVMLPLVDVAHPDAVHPVLQRPYTGLKDSLFVAGAARVSGEEDASRISRAVPVAKGVWQVGAATRIVASAVTAPEVAKAVESGAGAVVVSDAALLAEARSLGAKALLRAGDAGAVAAGLEAPLEKRADGVVLAAGADDAAVARVGKAAAAARCFVVVECGADDTESSDVDRLEHTVGRLMEAGVFRWQVVSSPALRHCSAVAAQYAKGQRSLGHAWYPQLWDLSGVAVEGLRAPSVEVLVQAAIQQKADLVVVNAADVAVAVRVAATADVLFRKSQQ